MRVEWNQLRGTWIPQSDYDAAHCSGTSSAPPPPTLIELQQSAIGRFEGGCDIAGITRLSEVAFRLSMRCDDFSDRSQRVTQTFAKSEGGIVVDAVPYVRCRLPGIRP